MGRGLELKLLVQIFLFETLQNIYPHLHILHKISLS